MSEETKTTERAAPVETVGDIMSEATRATIKKMVLFLSALVYVAAIVYAEVHGLTQLQAGIKPDMRFWATLGMIAAGVSAILFPLALKAWCFDSMHRWMCIVFYLLDFAFLAFNAFTDFNVQTGQQLAGWAQSYVYYVLPSSPLIVGAMWAILWELDPSTRAHVLRQTLKASIMEAKAKQIAQAAKRETVTSQVEAAADREVESALTELFGTPVTVRDPKQYEQAITQPTEEEKAAWKAEAKRLGMWDPNDPNDSPFERSRPELHRQIVADQLREAAKDKDGRVFFVEPPPTTPQSNNLNDYEYLRPPFGDRQHPDLVFARIPSGPWQIIAQEWLDYDNARTREVLHKDEADQPQDPFPE